MKPNIKKIVKICGTPESFCFDYISGSSIESDIRRMKEYVSCVKKVERDIKNNKKIKK
ncbi:MAG: hypothetical protein ACP5N7_05880 [Candidatus Pacearchaeota archaeon]